MTRIFVHAWTAMFLAGLCFTPAHAEEAPAAGEALSLDDCRKVWNLAAGRSDLGREQAKGYVDDFSAVDSNGDGKISNSEFLAGCEKGLAHAFKRPE